MSGDRVHVVTGPGACVVRLDGEIDMASAAELDAEIRHRVVEAPTLVLDLTAVSFLDSAGVRLVDGLVGSYHRAGGTVLVVAPVGGSARFTLELSSFRADLLADTLAAALAMAGER